MNKRFDRIMRYLLWISFTIYIIFLIGRLFFHAYGGYYRHSGTSGGYNIVPLKTIIGYIINYRRVNFNVWFMNLFGNIIAFIPFGFFIRLLLNKVDNIVKAALFTFVFSLCVEIMQHVSALGIFDVDDIILNIFGGILGCLMGAVLKLTINVQKKG